MAFPIALVVASLAVPQAQNLGAPRCGRVGPSNGDPSGFVSLGAGRRFVLDPLLQVGGFGSGPDQLAGADTVKVDSYGAMYVIDDSQNIIRVYPSQTCSGDALETIDTATIENAGLGALATLQAIAVDNPDNGPTELFLIDRDANRVPESRILKRTGGAGGSWAQLPFTDFTNRPNDLVVDPFKRLLVAERNGSIDALLIDGSAKDLSFADQGTLELDEFEGLEVDDFKAIDVDLSGQIYVSDKDTGRILSINADGTPLLSIGSQGPGPEQFREEVEGVGVDRRGLVYGRDESGDRFLVFDAAGSFVAAFGERGFDVKQQENADEFFIDKQHDRFYIADDGNYRVSVHRMRPGGFWSNVLTDYDFPNAPQLDPVWIAGGVQGSAPGTEFDEPNELGFDALGRIWAGDVFNLRVQVFDAGGNFVASVGGGGSGPGQFVDAPSGKSGPEAMRSDSLGRMFVVDRGGQRVNAYDGTTLAVIGSFTSPDIALDDPTGLAIDSSDNLYIADQGTDLVHKFAFDGAQLNLLMTFQALDGTESILVKTETLALDEARDRLFASSEDESRAEVFELSSGLYLDEHVGERQVGVIPQNGRFADDIEGLDTDTVNDLLFMSDEANGRFIVHDLGSPDLFDNDEDYAFLGAFGRVGAAPGQFLSADGVAVSPSQNLVVIADQGNYRIQAFLISDIMGIPDSVEVGERHRVGRPPLLLPGGGGRLTSGAHSSSGHRDGASADPRYKGRAPPDPPECSCSQWERAMTKATMRESARDERASDPDSTVRGVRVRDSAARITLPAWIWLWPPILVIVAQLALRASSEDAYRTWMRGERGLVENVTVLFLVLAVVTAVRLFLRRRQVASRWFGPFVLVMGAGCFFFAGEEASWGQHWLAFATPEELAERNEQGEFNLHNDPLLEGLFDNLPRTLLSLAALVGGILVPVIRRRGRIDPEAFRTPGMQGWIWPTLACLPASLAASLVTFPKKIFRALDAEMPRWVDFSPGETKEFCLALFLLVYLLVLLRALDSSPAGSLRR